MRLRYNTKGKLGFHPVTWDTPVLQGDLGEQAPALLLEFYIDNTPAQVRVTLYINSGPEEYRKRLLDMAQRNKPLFKPAFAASYTVNQVFTRTWLTAKQLQEAELSEQAEALRKAWQHFVDHELAEIEKVVRGETWIWPAAGESPDE
jgi:hypothetical protein